MAVNMTQKTRTRDNYRLAVLGLTKEQADMEVVHKVFEDKVACYEALKATQQKQGGRDEKAE